MLHEKDIEALAVEIARSELGSREVEGATAELTSDSWGEDAISVTIVIAEGALDRVSDDAVLDTLVGIRKRLQASGDERFPIIGYVTRKELETVGDP